MSLPCFPMAELVAMIDLLEGRAMMHKDDIRSSMERVLAYAGGLDQSDCSRSEGMRDAAIIEDAIVNGCPPVADDGLSRHTPDWKAVVAIASKLKPG